MTQAPARTRRWTRIEYDRLIEVGILKPGDNVELLGGQLCVGEPQNSPHAKGIWLAQETLGRALSPGWGLRIQLPIALDEESEPEPDLAVVPGGPRDYDDDHPSRPVLLVEVADSSPSFDRQHKGSLYARAHVPEYWIVNLGDRVLEVYRDPDAQAEAPYGWGYHSIRSLRAGDHVTPLISPATPMAVADLLP